MLGLSHLERHLGANQALHADAGVGRKEAEPVRVREGAGGMGGEAWGVGGGVERGMRRRSFEKMAYFILGKGGDFLLREVLPRVLGLNRALEHGGVAHRKHQRQDHHAREHPPHFVRGVTFGIIS